MLKPVRSVVWKVTRFAALVAVTAVVTLLAARAYSALQGPPLRPWHTLVPAEMDVETLRTANWTNYLEAENDVFQSVQQEVVARLEPEDRAPANRYFDGSPLHSAHFARDWNRSFILTPQGEPLGAAVLLHGLTNSPYSVRHIAERYSAHGFVAVAIRLPGHGTVPGGLTDATWEDWLAATQLAVREAVLRGGDGKPLHIIGYSNGGALALKYALDALDDPALDAPDRVILMSPMIGVTGYARFAELAALPAYFPGIRQDVLAQHPAGVQSVQIQFVSGQRRPPVLPPDDGRADWDRCSARRRQTWQPAAHHYLPICGGQYGQRSSRGQEPSTTSCRRMAANLSCSISTAPRTSIC